MAPADEIAQQWTWIAVFSGLSAIVAAKFGPKYGRRLQQKIYAMVLSDFAEKYNKLNGKRKEVLFSPLSDLKPDENGKPVRVLEIGAGSGANFKYLPRGTHVVCVDPNPAFESYLMTSADEFPHVKVEFVVGYGEDMSEVPDDSIDAVICTLVMCSVESMDLCAREIKRVLKPGGCYYFMEHVRADENSWTHKLQNIFTPVWKVIADNCHLNRQPWKSLEKAGFALEYELFRARTLLLLRPHCSGVATKPMSKM